MFYYLNVTLPAESSDNRWSFFRQTLLRRPGHAKRLRVLVNNNNLLYGQHHAFADTLASIYRRSDRLNVNTITNYTWTQTKFRQRFANYCCLTIVGSYHKSLWFIHAWQIRFYFKTRRPLLWDHYTILLLWLLKCYLHWLLILNVACQPNNFTINVLMKGM